MELPCATANSVRSGDTTLPECREVVPNYSHPACGHVTKKPKCFERRAWEQTPPVCKVVVDFTRPCGCTLKLPCHEAISGRLNPAPCYSAVNMRRPRCGHELSVRCLQATALKKAWDEHQGLSAYVNPPPFVNSDVVVKIVSDHVSCHVCGHVSGHVSCHVPFMCSFMCPFMCPTMCPPMWIHHCLSTITAGCEQCLLLRAPLDGNATHAPG